VSGDASLQPTLLLFRFWSCCSSQQLPLKIQGSSVGLQLISVYQQINIFLGEQEGCPLLDFINNFDLSTKFGRYKSRPIFVWTLVLCSQ
jgi:hypothetical protein